MQLLVKILRHRQELLKADGLIESINFVDKHGHGAIHYLVTEKHKSKRQLLETLVIQEAADVDLTTTKQGYTALHLAVEVSGDQSLDTDQYACDWRLW